MKHVKQRRKKLYDKSEEMFQKIGVIEYHNWIK